MNTRHLVLICGTVTLVVAIFALVSTHNARVRLQTETVKREAAIERRIAPQGETPRERMLERLLPNREKH